MSPETSLGGHNKKRSKHNKIWYHMALKRWISIRYIIIYLETKFRQNRRIFVFWRPFLVQNGHHSKPKWSPYGAACLIPCKYPFPLKSAHFWIFNDFFNFYFENFNNKEHKKLPHTTVDILSKFHEVWWKESKKKMLIPLFSFYGNCGKVCSTDSDFFGLSRSTRCGCYS